MYLNVRHLLLIHMMRGHVVLPLSLSDRSIDIIFVSRLLISQLLWTVRGRPKSGCGHGCVMWITEW